jgi:hypothetical protein
MTDSDEEQPTQAERENLEWFPSMVAKDKFCYESLSSMRSVPLATQLS